ncbi:alpha/beta hydrolase [Reinekea sp. G2M2-21]|uniref:alpha/beta hydrolase n=1 Tax=Reinekea sp. G2M2-21 TaxID=2788942 RepID=UPI0018AAB0C1|nr:alpha/beta hydrolase-fold protein [Reinekea sp. G2M2-21]
MMVKDQIIELEVQWPEALQLSQDQRRRVWVWLPPDYHTSQHVYPVLFMHDGQNVFRDQDATYGTCWQMIQTQLQLSEPMIVVAIEGQNDAAKRFNEFSPWPCPRLSYWKGQPGLEAGGLADLYLEFLVNAIRPQVHRSFRCHSSAQHNYLGGSSMGGFVTLFAATRYEQAFSKYMAMSTATWFAHDELLGALTAHKFSPSTAIYVDVGTQETSNALLSEFPQVYLQGNIALFELLQATLAPSHCFSHIADDAVHNEAAWALRLLPALQWLSEK